MTQDALDRSCKMAAPAAAAFLNDKQLTAAIKNATSPERLADLARVHEG